MLCTLSDLDRDFLSRSDLCYILCDDGGIIRKCGRGLLAGYPHAFEKGSSLVSYFQTDEQSDSFISDLHQTGYGITPGIDLYGIDAYFCCFLCEDPQSKRKYILCKLEECGFKADDTVLQYKELMEQQNTLLLTSIAESCRSKEFSRLSEQIACQSEALLRNRVLLQMLDSIAGIGKDESTVNPGQLCSLLQKQLMLSESSLPIKVFVHCDTGHRGYFLDADRFFEAVFAMITLYAYTAKDTVLHLQLTESKDGFTLQSMANMNPDKQAPLLRNCLCEILQRFAKHYGGGASILQNGSTLLVKLKFSLIASDEEIGILAFENQPTRFSSIDRLLPLLRYANR